MWVAGLTILGLVILIAPASDTDIGIWFQPGQGTALLLVAANTLFAAVLPTLRASGNRLAAVAGVLTAIFGYAGTTIILAGENLILLAIVVLYTFYLALMAYTIISFARLVQYVIGRFR